MFVGHEAVIHNRDVRCVRVATCAKRARNKPPRLALA